MILGEKVILIFSTFCSMHIKNQKTPHNPMGDEKDEKDLPRQLSNRLAGRAPTLLELQDRH